MRKRLDVSCELCLLCQGFLVLPKALSFNASLTYVPWGVNWTHWYSRAHSWPALSSTSGDLLQAAAHLYIQSDFGTLKNGSDKVYLFLFIYLFFKTMTAQPTLKICNKLTFKKKKKLLYRGKGVKFLVLLTGDWLTQQLNLSLSHARTQTQQPSLSIKTTGYTPTINT